MDFSRMSDGIRLHHASHHHGGYDDDEPGAPLNGPWLHFMTGGGGSGAASTGHALFAGHGGLVTDSYRSGFDHAAVPKLAPDGHVGSEHGAAASSAAAVALGSSPPVIGSTAIESGANTAGNGGDGYFYGDIVHASLLIYEPINVSVTLGYGSVALADQTNNVSVDQSAFQMAGVGGNGGNVNIASGGTVSTFAGSDMLATGGNSAGNGGSGYFAGALVDAPVVIYHPINIAVAAPGGTAHANQSNTVEIDQSATQIAGVGGNGGNGNVAAGGSVITLDPAWGSSKGGASAGDVQTDGNHAGNGGDGSFSGELVHTSFVLYDPVNVAVAGYSSSSDAVQTNNVYVDQSAIQIAGIGGNGGNGNAAIGGSTSLLFHGLLGGSDAIATGSNGAGNGGSGHFAGSLIDISVAIYAPINIAIAGPHATAEADQINNVHIDQSAVQIAGVGGDGGSGNLALGGAVTSHLLADLHLA